MSTIAFLGLGTMGQPMAERLINAAMRSGSTGQAGSCSLVGARAVTLTIMVGGEASQFERVRPILGALDKI